MDNMSIFANKDIYNTIKVGLNSFSFLTIEYYAANMDYLKL